MNSQEAREIFLSYFEKQGHVRKTSSSLVPDNDPTVLLTTAGMQQFIPYFLGAAESPSKRYTSSQKCFRTPDIDVVGDESHLTFFEMLGNFSIGDYFKEDAIRFAWDLLTAGYGLDPERLVITIFCGDEKVPKDTEAREIWKSVGVTEDHIQELGRDSNFWGPPGAEGPCGPCTEVHYYFGEGKIPSNIDLEDGNFMELWNLVFMQYFQDKNGGLTRLKNTNVDTGMGLERLLRVLEHAKSGKNVSPFETDAFQPLIKKISELSGNKEEKNRKSFRVIADHIRGATFLIADGVIPHKEGRGYILRKVLRRAIESWKFSLHWNELAFEELAGEVIHEYKVQYPELEYNKDKIKSVIRDEVIQYSDNLDKGINLLEKERDRDLVPQNLDSNSELFVKTYLSNLQNSFTPEHLFYLNETHGLTPKVTKMAMANLSADFNIPKKEIYRYFDNPLNEKLIQEYMLKHQEISRRGMKDKFDRAGGGQGPERATSHTATHLLHAAVQKVLGPEALQAGSQLGDGEFRFDFRWPLKLTDEQKKAVEDLVNEQIEKNLTVEEHKMTIEEAKKLGAIALFEHKYGEQVRVFLMGRDGEYFSREVCGGPHVVHTKDIQFFKIVKEKSSSAGIRRIKAQVGKTPEGAELHL